MNYKHGETNTKLHTTWLNIKKRCLNPNNKSYKDYGGRGIAICPEWINDYTKFRDWSLNNGYADNLEIDRWPNNDGNYEPSNCRWTTRTENNRNQRKTKIKDMEMANKIRELDKTGKYTQKELAEKYNVTQGNISSILNNKRWENNNG